MKVQAVCILSILLLFFLAPAIEHTDAGTRAVDPEAPPREPRAQIMSYCMDRKQDFSNLLNHGLKHSKKIVKVDSGEFVSHGY